MNVGVISDTHGMLRPEVFRHFAGVEHIVHAGDVGDEDLLLELEAIAPVTAVWGNTDGWKLRQRLPEVARIALNGVDVVVVHGQQYGSPTPARLAADYPDAGLIVFGHTHRPLIERQAGVLAVNPGSAGPMRFGVVPTLALAELTAGRIDARLIRFETPPAV